MHFLFVKHSLAWPRSSGHDVHSYYMMRALIGLGHEVSLATFLPVSAESKQGLDLSNQYSLDATTENEQQVKLTWLQEKFRSYWGIEWDQIHAVRNAAISSQADVVVAVGLEVLPYLANLDRCQRVWYAADEWFWHHMSLVRVFDRTTWKHVHAAFLKGVYERSYRSVIDQAWVVSDRDRRAMKLVAGVKSVPVLPNGVDTDHYCRSEVSQLAHSCVFWGRLDFEPNIQALEWFCNHIWPRVIQKQPLAKFQIYGFNPTDEVIALAKGDGVTLTSDLPDIRSEISKHQVVVLPFTSGGGIKNKLLEAASMSLPILCTRRTTNGLNSSKDSPLLVADSADYWASQLDNLWNDGRRRNQLGEQLRAWVISQHSWRSTAERAIAAVEQLPSIPRE